MRRPAMAHLLRPRYDVVDDVREVLRRVSWGDEAYRLIREEAQARGRVFQARRNILLIGTRLLGEPDPVSVATLEAIHDIDALRRLIDSILAATSWREALAASDAR